MDAKLRISRLSGWARYRVVLDGVEVAALGRGESAEMEVASGSHTLQLFSRLGLKSRIETFSVRAGETAAFTCRSRGSRIALDRLSHNATGDDGSSAERDLVKQVQAAQNQPGLPR